MQMSDMPISCNAVCCVMIRFTASIVSGYDVLVNEDKSRSFVCLRVRGGRHLVRQLIKKSDTVMERFKQPVYYEVPLVETFRPTSIAHTIGYR